jgi:hypothetical protein
MNFWKNWNINDDGRFHWPWEGAGWLVAWVFCVLLAALIAYGVLFTDSSPDFSRNRDEVCFQTETGDMECV